MMHNTHNLKRVACSEKPIETLKYGSTVSPPSSIFQLTVLAFQHTTLLFWFRL